MRLFNLDLHVSVIADVGDVASEFGHEVTSWTLSNHAWVFGRRPDPVEVVTQDTWRDLSADMCDAFRERYAEELSTYDAFVVTHTPAFALLFRGLGKPVLVVNSTRYEQPFTLDERRWAWLDQGLAEMTDEGSLVVVSNNFADQEYLREHTGISSSWIPSLCRYTRARYQRRKRKFILHARSDLGLELPAATRPHLITPEWAFRTLGRPRRYRWSELYSYAGIVHIPYQVSTMSIFEQYTANVPLFFPSRELLLRLREEGIGDALADLSNFDLLGGNGQRRGLNRTSDGDVLGRWLDLADFYDGRAMPFIVYYESFEHLAHLLDKTDLDLVSRNMASHNLRRQQEALEAWGRVFDSLGG